MGVIIAREEFGIIVLKANSKQKDE